MRITAYLSLIALAFSLLLFRYLKPQKVETPAPIVADTMAILPQPVSYPAPTQQCQQQSSSLPIVPIPHRVPWPRKPTNYRNNTKKKRRRTR